MNHEPFVTDVARTNRMMWRAKRGLLENDLILEKFFQRYGSQLTESHFYALDALLDLPDGDLLDLFMARKRPNELEAHLQNERILSDQVSELLVTIASI